jgi:hypothetical protein
MRNVYHLITILTTSSVGASAQGTMERTTNAKLLEITRRCDEVRGDCPTTVNLGEVAGQLELSIHVVEPIGGKKVKPTSVSMMFGSFSPRWKYLEYHTVSFLLNKDTRWRDEGKHNGNVHRGFVSETVWIQMPMEIFLQLAKSKEVKGAIGSTDFSFTKEQREAISKFAEGLVSKDSPE